MRSLPIKQNQRGQISTTPTLQVLDHPEIFALGDLADCLDAEGQQVPTTAQAAFHNEIAERITTKVSWQKRDILIIDNTRILHGRRAFDDEKREIYIRLCSPAFSF